jgi:hypothetical protein
MKLEPFDCLGLKDMHKDQISTLMEFVATALNAAAEVEDDGECLNDMQEKAGRACPHLWWQRGYRQYLLTL